MSIVFTDYSDPEATSRVPWQDSEALWMLLFAQIAAISRTHLVFNTKAPLANTNLAFWAIFLSLPFFFPFFLSYLLSNSIGDIFQSLLVTTGGNQIIKLHSFLYTKLALQVHSYCIDSDHLLKKGLYTMSALS